MTTRKPLILIKLGGSVITDKSKPYTARISVIKSLAKQLKKSPNPLVISHGSGSFAHTSAKRYGGMRGYASTYGIAKVARDAMEINRIVMDVFLEEKLPAISLRPMSMIIAEKGKSKDNFFGVIKEALTQHLIPVIYGDVIFDTNWKSTIFSGEKTLGLLAGYLQKNNFPIVKIIEVGDTNGIYDNSKKTIPEITLRNWKHIKKYCKTITHDVTGGMEHKVEEALIITKLGIPTLLINGNVPQELSRALSQRATNGTHIL